MQLKTATGIAIIALIIHLIMYLLMWACSTFHLLDFSKYRMPVMLFHLSWTLLYFIPMLIFFFVLRSKQIKRQSESGH